MSRMRADADLRPTVSTSTGAVRGTRHDGVDRYLGIPYALPPFGATAVSRWDGRPGLAALRRGS